jgi:hypothetical protein
VLGRVPGLCRSLATALAAKSNGGSSAGQSQQGRYGGGEAEFGPELVRSLDLSHVTVVDPIIGGCLLLFNLASSVQAQAYLSELGAPGRHLRSMMPEVHYTMPILCLCNSYLFVSTSITDSGCPSSSQPSGGQVSGVLVLLEGVLLNIQRERGC